MCLERTKIKLYKEPIPPHHCTPHITKPLYTVCIRVKKAPPIPNLPTMKINLTLLKDFSAACRVSSLFCSCQQIQNAPNAPRDKGLCFSLLCSNMHNKPI